ncbi:MAG: hypothetical protein RSB55_10245, partial [Oscillospiraceae bacterium]
DGGTLYLSGNPTMTSKASLQQINCAPGATVIANDGNTSSPSYSTGNISIKIPERQSAGYVAVSGLRDADHAGQFTFASVPANLTTVYDNGTKSIKLATQPESAVAPAITSDLITTQVSYNKNATATPLDATATVTDGGTISYAWYSNTTDSTIGGTDLNVATATYTPPTATAGTTYYYCVVTNTNSAATTTQTATTTSAVANIKVTAAVPTVKTATPVFESGYNLGRNYKKYDLTNDYASKKNTINTVYKLYSAVTGTDTPAGMTVKPGDYGGFAVSGARVPTDCYVTATAPGFSESERVALRVLPEYAADGVTVEQGQVHIKTPAQLRDFLNYCTPAAATLDGNTVTLTKDAMICYDINLEANFDGV